MQALDLGLGIIVPINKVDKERTSLNCVNGTGITGKQSHGNTVVKEIVMGCIIGFVLFTTNVLQFVCHHVQEKTECT
jgi:hypothetical protein